MFCKPRLIGGTRKMFKVIVIFASVIAFVAASHTFDSYVPNTPQEYLERFVKYAQKYDRGYLKDIDSFVDKFGQYASNLQTIYKHNDKYKNGEVTFYLSEGPFTDMSLSDFRNNILSKFHQFPERCGYFDYNKLSYPSEMDWRSKNAVTDVKNQGQCGSCWSFSATGALEGLTAITTGKLVSLSEQELVDCSKANSGCNGGLMTFAFEYVIKNGGLCLEEDYTYSARDGTCQSCDVEQGTEIHDCKQIKSGDSEGLVYSLSKQPISVGIQADTFTFQHYGGGVFSDPKCYTGDIDHGVLLVAYTNDTLTIKNSWGETWGDGGYITLARTDDDVGICGVYTSASFPTK